MEHAKVEHSLRARCPVAVMVFLISAAISPAATYYVDMDGGNDSNAGTATMAAWKTIPGTRTVDNGGWQSSSWGGVISTTNKVASGTIFRLKRGTSHGSSKGGPILIDSTFYEEATGANPITIEVDTSWGTGAVNFVGTGVTDGIGLIQIRMNGIKIDGKANRGIIIQRANHSGIQVKEKPGSSASVDGTVLKYIYFFSNGQSYSSSSEGTGDANLNVRKANGLTVTDCEFNGNNIHVNGMLLGDSSKQVTNAVISNTVAFSHLGNDPPNDCGIGFKALNSQVVYLNCFSDSNLKGWDLGESNGDSVDINYRIVNSTSTNNKWGINMNCSASTSYAGSIRFYLINCIIANNSFLGSNIYAGPFDLYVVHSIFSQNGSDTSSTKYQGNLNVTPNSETDLTTIRAYLYNNIFYKPAGHTNLVVKYSVASNKFSLFSDYNWWVADDAVHSNGQVFARWSYFKSPAVDFSYGADGPGQSSGKWYSWYNSDTTPPASGGLGHYHADAHSIGSGTSSPQEPSFVSAASLDYHMSVSQPGFNLSTEGWYVSEMGIDRDGNARSKWNLGPYENSAGSSTLGVPRNLRLKQ